ncbi:T3SS effector HopA1 family protein [Modestobacter italicus]|uniref:T3SS effector HopA1 family protein n=1 Tax=Modestobacter italicus (strain DSM 44449 / CECT 9708 / BC 501) TaxID=2732864 RepID=UPI001C97ABD7|nr:T3SS effector HopA1 family protein [Modestobacter italicus]
MTTVTVARPAATTVPSSLTGVLAALDAVRVDASTWTARVGRRELSGGSPADLRPQLVGAMYEVLHAGRAEEKDLGRIVREGDVEQVLAASLPHDTAPRRARLLRREDDGGAVVDLGDVRVRLPAELTPAGVAVDEVTELRLPAARPGLSYGFFLVDGPRGAQPPGATPLRRLYVHAQDPESAATAWRRALEVLNAAGVHYRSKTLSHRDGYPRRDAVVVYLPATEAHLVQDVSAAVAGCPGLGEDVSAFAHRIAPGIAVADEPHDPRPQYRGLSFGEHRCSLAAAALMRHAEDPTADLAELLAEECQKAAVDPDDLAFNQTPHTERTPA